VGDDRNEEGRIHLLKTEGKTTRSSVRLPPPESRPFGMMK